MNNSSRFFPKIDAVGVIPKHDRTAWLKGGDYHCAMPPRIPVGKVWHIIVLGPPGFGKETQASMLCERLGVCHLSTDDVFRAATNHPKHEVTPATQNVLDYMERGESVPDEAILSMVGERLDCLHCSGGFLLDGFPRTVAQAKALDQLLENHDLKLTAVFNYYLPIERIVARSAGLPTDKKNHPAALRSAVETYQKSIKPLIEFYQQRGLLVNIDAQGTAEEIYHRTRLSALAL